MGAVSRYTNTNTHTGTKTWTGWEITETKKTVKKGEILANILNPLDCSIAEEIKSPVNGTIFFTQSKSLAYANAVLFRIIPEGK